MEINLQVRFEFGADRIIGLREIKPDLCSLNYVEGVLYGIADGWGRMGGTTSLLVANHKLAQGKALRAQREFLAELYDTRVLTELGYRIPSRQEREKEYEKACGARKAGFHEGLLC